MTAPILSRRFRIWFAALALTAGLTAGCTAGDWRYDAPPAAGVQADEGLIKARNILLVADESGDGVLNGSIASADAVSLTGIVVQAETADGGRGDAVPVDIAADIPRNGIVKLDASNAEVSGADLLLGRTATVALQFADGTQIVVEAPVMSSEHPDFTIESGS